MLAEARAQAEAELNAVREEVERVRTQLAGISRERGQPVGACTSSGWPRPSDVLAAARRLKCRPPPPVEAPKPILIDGPLQPGDKVWVPSLQASGEVVGLGGRDDRGESRGLPPAAGSQNRVELRQRGEQLAVQVERLARSRGRPARGWSWICGA